MREFGGGRKWYFGHHTKYLERWHELERRRGHAIDRTDMKSEWIDQLEIDLGRMSKAEGRFTHSEQKLYDAMKQKQHTLTKGTEKAQIRAVDVMCAKIGARMHAT